MSNTLSPPRPAGHGARLDADAVRTAYRRWAGVYDPAFGMISAGARRWAVDRVNGLPGTQVLEVGVGTGLALPLYAPAKQITGIDLSAEMLQRARERVARQGLAHVVALEEQDAEETHFPDASFDIAVAMFVASVVPQPRRLLAEMRRVVRPGGHILFINHFAALRGPRWWVERSMAPAARILGWHPDFARDSLFGPADLAGVTFTGAPPFGFFTLAQLDN
jgi:phosphatidylethanolamine/phosphatidyl-N-methylethanolamine N-methyltransferase